MSQKPRTAAQTKPAPVTKVAAKDAEEKTVAAGPMPDAKAEPTADETTVPAQPMPDIEPEPPAMAEPVTHVAPVAKAEPVTTPVDEAPVAATATTTEATGEPIAVATEAAPPPAAAITNPMTATAQTIAAVTAEAEKMAVAIKPTRPTLTQGMQTMMKSTEDFVAFNQANFEAFVKSGQIWSAGVQELTKQIASSAKASFDEFVSTFKAISTAKSVKEALDLQSSFAKAALEKAMAESNKLTDASIKLTEQTLAPITARVTVAVETFGKAA